MSTAQNESRLHCHKSIIKYVTDTAFTFSEAIEMTKENTAAECLDWQSFFSKLKLRVINNWMFEKVIFQASKSSVKSIIFEITKYLKQLWIFSKLFYCKTSVLVVNNARGKWTAAAANAASLSHSHEVYVSNRFLTGAWN